MHVNKLTIELGKAVGCLYRLRELIPMKIKYAIYYANFYSRLSYCTLVWGTTTTTNYNKLERLQKKVLRSFENFNGHPSLLPTGPLFIKHNMWKASKLYDYKLYLYMYKNKLPSDTEYSPYDYSIRNRLIPVPRTRTNYGRSRLDYCIPTLYNLLKTHIDFSAPVATFKSEVRDYLMKQ